MSKSELRVLQIFRTFLMTSGQMLCLQPPQLQTYRVAIGKLVDKDFLVKATFKGGYCLTDAGYAAMKNASA